MPDKKPKSFGYREDVLEALLKLLGPYDDVTRDNMFGFPAFRASGQIFACVYQNGISLKMPKAAAEAIVQSPGISPFVPFGRARMRQWIHIERKKPASYIKDFPLIEASIHYVRTLKPKKSAKKAGKASAPAGKTPTATENTSRTAPVKSAPKAAAKTPEKQAPSKTSPTATKSAPKKKSAPGAPAGKKKASASAKTSGKKAPAKKSASRTAVKKKPAKKAAPATRKPAAKKASRTAGKAVAKGRK